MRVFIFSNLLPEFPYKSFTLTAIWGLRYRTYSHIELGSSVVYKERFSANRWKDFYTGACRFLTKENPKIKERKKHRSNRIAEYRMTTTNDIENIIVLRNAWFLESSLNRTKATWVLYSFQKPIISLYFLERGKTADLSRRHQGFPREITSEKRAQIFHTDDSSLPRSG